MNSKDRAALRGVVRGRFRMIRKNFDAAAKGFAQAKVDEVHLTVADRKAEFEAKAEKAKAKLADAIRVFFNTLDAAVPEGAKLGWHALGMTGAGNNDRMGLIPRVWVEFPDINRRATATHAEAQRAANRARLELDRREVELLEELTVGDLEADAAAYLAALPTLDTMLALEYKPAA